MAAGEALLAPEIKRRLIDRFVSSAPRLRPVPAAVDALTQRERPVLAQVARGLSNAEIGRALLVSEGTVKTHVAYLLAKLGLRDRVQVVVFAYEQGLVRSGWGRQRSAGSAARRSRRGVGTRRLRPLVT